MAKPWGRYEIGFMRHPKFLALSGNALALWWEGKNYCDEHHTDGLIPMAALKGFRFRGQKTVALLTTSCGQKADGTHYAPLWETHPIGIKMHDYLEYNDSRDIVKARIEDAELRRELDRRRLQLWRNKDLTAQIRARDGEHCRYCWRAVNWADRRGADGATYDHVDPLGGNTLENLVVCCRGCNSVKGSRTPEMANMVVRQPKASTPTDQLRRSRSVVDRRPATETETTTPTATKEEREDPVSEGTPTEVPAVSGTTRGVAPPMAPLFLEFPTDGNPLSWALTDTQVTAWQGSYGSLDVAAECRKALAWVQASPTHRKTAGGMPRFLVNWLNRATNRPHGGVRDGGSVAARSGRTGAPPPGKYDGIEES